MKRSLTFKFSRSVGCHVECYRFCREGNNQYDRIPPSTSSSQDLPRTVAARRSGDQVEQIRCKPQADRIAARLQDLTVGALILG